MKKLKKTNKPLRTRDKKRENLIGWLFCSPYFLYTIVMFLIPLIWAVWLSTMDWNLMSENRIFVGIKNFIDLFSDEAVKRAFLNSFRYLIPIVFLCVAGGMGIALVVNELPERIKGAASVVMFIPYLTSGVATAVLVKYMCAYNSVLNIFLRDHFNLKISWFTDKKAAFCIIVGIVVWKCCGYYAMFFLSALQGISEEILEAASLDGATGMRQFFCIKLPLMLPSISSVTALAAGLALGIYTEPYLLTSGGPSGATTSWILEIYYSAFTNFRSGYGTAMAILYAIEIFIILKLIDFIMNKLIQKFGC